MKSYEFHAVIYCATVYCTGCLPEGVSVEDEEVMAIFSDAEWGYVPVCEKCGKEHDYMTILPPEDTRLMLCPACRGSTFEGDEDCSNCGGTGTVLKN